MKRKFCSIVLLFTTFLLFFAPVTISAAPTTEMNIYAIYLDSPDRGDCALIESKGHALLMDIGCYNHIPAILKQLKALGITHVDICFSHLHPDHTASLGTDANAGLRLLINSGITIDHLYLPSKSLAIYSPRYLKKCIAIENFMFAYTSIQYLSMGDSITVGDAKGQVIGPIVNNNDSPFQYSTPGESGTNEMYTKYENNNSLAMIFTCGNTRYFTAGDAFEEETSALCERYGEALHSDIMKLCHHGTPSGNSSQLIDLIKPHYSFCSNISFTGKNAETGRWATYSAFTRAARYGMCYAVGTEKKTLIYHVVNDDITLYKGLRVTPSNKLTGWQHFYGSDGVNMNYNTYYLDQNCKPLTGAQHIGKHDFFFDETGLMKYGSFSSSGNYRHWIRSSEGKQYYTLTSNRKYAYLAVGLKKIGDSLYYFDKNGYLYIDPAFSTGEAGEDDTVITKIGSDYYATDNTGALLHNEWYEEDDYEYFFQKDGKMTRNCLYKVDGIPYLFDTDGTLITSYFSKYDLINLKNKLYAVDRDGEVVMKKAVKIDGKNYYFGSNGVMVKNAKITWKGKKYKCNASGVMKRIK